MIEPSARKRAPIFNVPPATTALLMVNVAVHLCRLLLSSDVDSRFLLTFAFVPARYTLGPMGWPAVLDPITYQFLHANLTHLGVNMLALLAFGSGVERHMGRWRMLAFTIICGVIAAFAHVVAYPTSIEPVIGASGAISGLFGGVLRMQARTLRSSSSNLWPLIVLWVVVTVIAGQAGMPGDLSAPIAWVAHLGGFFAGLALFGLFDRRGPFRSAG